MFQIVPCVIPSCLGISWESIHPFLCYVANRQRQTTKQVNRDENITFNVRQSKKQVNNENLTCFKQFSHQDTDVFKYILAYQFLIIKG